MNEAVMSGELEQLDQLSRTERMQLTWVLAWPCIVLSLAYGFLRSQLQLSEALLDGIDLAIVSLQFFVFSTWVVRRAVGLSFRGFRLMVFRGDTPDGTRTMRYGESLSVAWLLCWGSAMFELPIFVAFWVVEDRQPPSFGLFSLLWSSAVELLVFYFWIVGAAIGKRYARFSLRLDRSAL